MAVQMERLALKERRAQAVALKQGQSKVRHGLCRLVVQMSRLVSL